MNIMTADQQARIIYELQRNYRFGEWHARLGLDQDFRCIYCGVDYLASYNEYRSAELDHIYPTSLGGEEDYENRAVCCRTCNLLKRDYEPTGNTREDRIADARRHVQQLRFRYDAELTEIRFLISSALNLVSERSA